MLKYLKSLFIDHPREVGETYFEHQRFAMGTSIILLFLGVCALIHSLMPFTLKDVVSRGVHKLSDRFSRRENLRDDWW